MVNRILLLEAICVPVVELIVWSGMTLENKKKVVEGTKVIEEVGISRDATTIIIYEEPKENWATGGKLRSESQPEDPNLEDLRHITRRNRGLEYCHKMT